MIRNPLRIFSLVLIGLLSLALLAACSSDDSSSGGDATSTSETDETTVSVTLKEWAVEADSTSVPAGEVKFNVSNQGTIPHEMVIARNDGDAGSLPVEDSKVVEDQVDVVGEVEQFAAGESSSGSFTLEPGSYVLFCNIPAHYEQGMHLAFTVE